MYDEFSEFKKNKKNNFPTDRPIPEKQGRVRGNKNIFKVGLNWIIGEVVACTVGSAGNMSFHPYQVGTFVDNPS